MQSEDIDKGKMPEGLGAQFQAIKSPSVLGHKTPQNLGGDHDQSKVR
jgi:hypothetical protein